ncbi:hypothetical protein KIL84_013251 [Mauremys mutica]|uniref:Uncharacterized protein n=1 Tax=Mauremys mutica TaxID=74926 RepID=A0A9D4AU58_9SAUR|nr:hypothetical protein KIL84_013251 [Mauremys mutica]
MCGKILQSSVSLSKLSASYWRMKLSLALQHVLLRANQETPSEVGRGQQASTLLTSLGEKEEMGGSPQAILKIPVMMTHAQALLCSLTCHGFPVDGVEGVDAVDIASGKGTSAPAGPGIPSNTMGTTWSQQRVWKWKSSEECVRLVTKKSEEHLAFQKVKEEREEDTV